MQKTFKWSTFSIAFIGIVLICCACSLFGSSDTPVSNVTSSTSSTASGPIDHICDHVIYKAACEFVVRRYKFWSDPNRFGYFYGFVQGVPTPVIEYVVQGPVLPTSDLVSNPNYQEPCNDAGNTTCSVVLDKQQPDGTYSTNGNAMFGWTADGNYFEWDGPYAYAEEPLSFNDVKVVGCKVGVPGC